MAVGVESLIASIHAMFKLISPPSGPFLFFRTTPATLCREQRDGAPMEQTPVTQDAHATADQSDAKAKANERKGGVEMKAERAIRRVALAAAFGLMALGGGNVVFGQAPTSPPMIALSSVHKIYIEKMGAGNLDQYLRAEFIKQAKGRLTVALDKADADAILTGSTEEKTGVGHAITGRYLGLEDNNTAAISLVDPTGKQLLWATEAGDRSLFFSVAHRGGERKVAERIVSQLLKAIHH